MDARALRRLAGVNERRRNSVGEDLGIQRRHEEERSKEIARYVRNGYPFSILSEARREDPENAVLRKPGWLPTALVVNILTQADERSGLKVAAEDLVEVRRGQDGTAEVLLPDGFDPEKWRPTSYQPIEIIDGQHRLFAFGPETDQSDFQLPVVAFVGLDISWQAYLFWTINIKPKKINASLAFDLYPLLRTEDWLDAAEQFSVYRETRAQEIIESLWSYPKSAWYDRIDMLGERRGGVSQASFIRSLLATLIKRRAGRGITLGGLFGATLPGTEDPLPWSRVQQAAFVILFWQLLRDAVAVSEADWCKSLRKAYGSDAGLDDVAFIGRTTLLNQDQGVRVVLHVLNDLTVLESSSLKLANWVLDTEGSPLDPKVISMAIESLRKRVIARFLFSVASALATFDWRSANAPGLSEREQRDRLAYRGAGGYRSLRMDVLKHLLTYGDDRVSQAAKRAQAAMRREKQ